MEEFKLINIKELPYKKDKIDWIEIFKKKITLSYDFNGKIFNIKPIKYDKNGKMYVEYNGEIRNTNSYKLKTGNIVGVINNKKKSRLKVGINDIQTLYPDIVSTYFINNEDGKLSPYSDKIIQSKCPKCGAIKQYRVYNFIRKGFCCDKCGDGRSFGEKYIYEVLTQLNLEFSVEKTFEWSKNKRYDFYFHYKNEKYIIECNGIQHYNNVNFFNNKIQLNSIIDNDNNKINMAINNGIMIDNYIVIDASISSGEYLKNSILNSKLNKIFNLDKIDWNRCLYQTKTSKLVEACELFNKGLSYNEISKKIRVSVGTVMFYLKKGSKITPSLCNYNEKQSHINGSKKGAKISGNKHKKPIVVFKDGKIITKQDSTKDTIEYIMDNFNIELHRNSIASNYYGIINNCKGFQFIQEKIYNELKEKGYSDSDFMDWENKIQPILKNIKRDKAGEVINK